MVWDVFSAAGIGPLIDCSNKLNFTEYQKILEKHFLPYYQQIQTNQKIFQQDDAPPHKATSTQEWLRQHEILTMAWPPCSPDLNSIENLWSYVSQQVYKNGKQFTNKNDLKKEIFKIL